ncbi:hypothetical protein K7432_011449 [Basidiobolus ranarum]|uniref:GH18 domain-containing protein n=1 Tax=Basidiobolus ranarum TaxID=34480 RepID=A0ABR2WMC3_9FUNG
MKITLLVLSVISAAITLSPSALAADDKVIVGYYVPWGNVQPSQLSYDKVTHINYGFGVLTKKNDPANIFIDPDYDGPAISQLKTLAKAKGVKVQISIGGWTGSQTFSLVARDAALRQKFINNALVFVRKNTKAAGETPDGWDLDGIDIDWEYPARDGAICNVKDASDTANYLTLLKELRAALDKEFPSEHKLITAAVRVQPFDGPYGGPLNDVSQFIPYFDFINVMAYDINGGWSATTGPNAPFDYDTKGGDPFSFRQSSKAWLDAKWPANKLVMGLPFYGRSLTATVDMNTNPSNQYVSKQSTVPKGDPSDSNTPNAFCNEGSVYGGLWAWKYLRSEILKNGPTSPIAGWNRYWDNTTQTPWLFGTNNKMYISYDDPQSLKVKADYTKKQGLRGVMFWDMTNDSNDELLNAVQGVRQPDSTTTAKPPVSTTTGNTSTTNSNKPSTTATSTPTTTPGTGICAGVATWSSNVAYNGSQKTTYNGHLWQAKWWTQNDTPGNNSQNVWTDLGAC